MEKQGSNFFEFDGAKGIAATITLHEDILKDLKKYSSWGGEPGNVEDNTNLLELIGLRDNKEFSGALSPPRNPPRRLPKIHNLQFSSR